MYILLIHVTNELDKDVQYIAYYKTFDS